MVLGFLLVVGLATLLVLTALRQNLSYFRTPSDVVSGQYPEAGTDRSFRLGGMVEKGSLERKGTVILFKLTDMKNTMPVEFNGIPPDLFREGQGVVAEGHMQNGIFAADTLLAKHDEKYQPPELRGMMLPQNAQPQAGQ